jgi:hypothetical protein
MQQVLCAKTLQFFAKTKCSSSNFLPRQNAVLAKWHVNDHHYLSPDLPQPLMGNFNN